MTRLQDDNSNTLPFKMVSDKEMLERIAKLSSAIEQRKRGGASGYSGRGRGVPHVAGYHQTYGPPNRTLHTTTTPPLSQHRTLNNNKTSGQSSPNQLYTLANSSNSPALSQYRPVNNITSQHRTLNNTVTNSPLAPPVISQHRTLVNNAQMLPVPIKRFASNAIPAKPITASSHNRTLILNPKGPHQIIKSMEGGKKKVSIDGVEFIVKGKKLIRQDLLDKSAPIQSTAPKVLIRRSVKRHKSHNLTATPNKISKMASTSKFKKGYVRTGRSGKSLVLKPTTKAKHCGFFTRYGQCPKADVGRCLFKHDRERRAICMRFLRGQCKKSAAQCRLSHSPNPHILPHCAHFQKGNCNNPNCPYAHVGLSPDAPVCRAFAMEGYCPKGQACHQKHVHLCPEFAETSKCSNINCRLPHVARKTADTKTTGIVRLGSWVSPKYFYEQKMAKEERKKTAASSKVWSRPQVAPETTEKSEEKEKPIDREQEEEQGFVRLFDDSDDDEGWSQFEREDTADNSQSLRFNDEEEEEPEEEGEIEENEEDQEGGDNEEMEEEEEEMEQDDQSDDEGQFYDAEENVKEVIVLSDDDSDMEEVYEEVSDDDISEEDLT
ncbi:hypothetical protein K501DRAFT_329029 [Backusella circina FSU 941]|nr:hypothetical protein K501DRAFT_329029 [Backusella circina FSU 941]